MLKLILNSQWTMVCWIFIDINSIMTWCFVIWTQFSELRHVILVCVYLCLAYALKNKLKIDNKIKQKKNVKILWYHDFIRIEAIGYFYDQTRKWDWNAWLLFCKRTNLRCYFSSTEQIRCYKSCFGVPSFEERDKIHVLHLVFLFRRFLRGKNIKRSLKT